MRALRPGALAFFVLLAATLLTAVVVVRARTPDLVLEVTSGVPCAIDPDAGRPRPAVIAFFVRDGDPDARVAIVDGTERVVRTLDPDVHLAAGERAVYEWNARNDEGAVVARGRYRLLVELPGEGREMVWPQRISVGIPGEARPCPRLPEPA